MKRRIYPGVFSLVILVVGLIFMVVDSCKKQAFFADSTAQIRISADRLNIQLNESVRISLLGYNSDGSFLLDGTRVDLTIENGTLGSSWVELEDGTASVIATGNMERGEMKITGRSGSAVAEPNPLVIKVGQIPDVSQIVASLHPPALPYEGGRIEIIVTVYDNYFQPLAGAAVILEADAGTLDSRGAPMTTNQSGQVTDFLEAQHQCTVTIYSGDVTKTVAVAQEDAPQPNVEPVADFTYSPLDPISGEVVYFNASASSDADGTIEKYTWDFGDGTSSGGKTTTHKFDVGEFLSKTFTVSLTVVDNQGAHDTYSKQITIDFK
jgi:hypothetical protein